MRTGERSYIVLLESEGMKSYSFRPDVSVTRPRGRTKAAKKGGMALAVPTGESEPMTLRPFIQEEHREAFVEIYEADPGQRLVTSIEVLSPSNKRPGTEGWELYRASGKVSCWAMSTSWNSTCSAAVGACPCSIPGPTAHTRCWSPERRLSFAGSGGATPFGRCRRSPYPSRNRITDIPLDLQPMIGEIYQRFRYARSIDYSKPLDPPLEAAEALWLEKQLRKRRGPR